MQPTAGAGGATDSDPEQESPERAQIVGMKGGPNVTKLNNTWATVEGYDEGNDKYLVLCDLDGQHNYIKANNLRFEDDTPRPEK